MIWLILLILLILAFGLGAVVKGVLWLMLIAVLVAAVVAVLGSRALSR